jgi:hypothetical protein
MEVESPAEREPLTETQPSLRGAFEDVYRFILQAVKGDRATAETIFEDYLDGKRPKNYCLFREVASARVKQAPLTVASRRDGWRNEQGGAGGKRCRWHATTTSTRPRNSIGG